MRPIALAESNCCCLQTLRCHNPLPRLSVDCGTEDFLIEDNRTFHRELSRLGVAHEYREFAGAHTWDYWDEHVRDALAFHLDGLRMHD